MFIKRKNWNFVLQCILKYYQVWYSYMVDSMLEIFFLKIDNLFPIDT